MLNVNQSWISRKLAEESPKLPQAAMLMAFAKYIGLPTRRYGISTSDIDTDSSGSHLVEAARVARRVRVSGKIAEAHSIINASRLPHDHAGDYNSLVSVELDIAAALVKADTGGVDRAVACLQSAYRALGSKVYDSRTAYVASQLGNQLRMQGHLADASHHLEESLSYSKDPFNIASTAPLLARIQGQRGNRAAFERSIGTAKEAVSNIGKRPGILSEYALTEFEIRGYVQLGDLVQARRVSNSVNRTSDLLATRHWRIIAAITNAELLALENDPAAVDELRSAAEAANHIGLPRQLERTRKLAALLPMSVREELDGHIRSLQRVES